VDTLIKNNIFANSQNPLFDNPGTNTTFTNNLCDASGLFCNIVNANPAFVNAAAADFRPQSTSPAVNSGTTLAEVTTDFVGGTRPQGSGYDIGAYEFSQSSSLNAPSNLLVSP
jgi:hypothetical protein